MKTILGGLALVVSLFLGTAPAFAAATVLPSSDPGTQLWQAPGSKLHLPADFAAQVAAREAVNGLKFRVIVTSGGDDLSPTDHRRWAAELLHNKLWDRWLKSGGFSPNQTVVLLYVEEPQSGPGSTGVRVGRPLNEIGIRPDHLTADDGPVRPVVDRYMPDQAGKALLQVIDNINSEVSNHGLLHFNADGPVAAATGAAAQDAEPGQFGPLLFGLAVCMLLIVGMVAFSGSSSDGPPPSSVTNRPEKRGSGSKKRNSDSDTGCTSITTTGTTDGGGHSCSSCGGGGCSSCGGGCGG